jgi:hypothetical protein
MAEVAPLELKKPLSDNSSFHTEETQNYLDRAKQTKCTSEDGLMNRKYIRYPLTCYIFETYTLYP